MTVGIGAGGYVGIALETVSGTFQAPTKFFPIRSESMSYSQDSQWRKVIRGIADVLGGINGYSHVEGDIEMELLADVLPYFLKASRNTVVKTGAGPYVYTTTPLAIAQPATTMSIVVYKNAEVFAFTGCCVGSMEFGTDSGVATAKYSMVGLNEADQSDPTPTYTNQAPFGAGTYSIQIPTASQVFDVENFTFAIEDNADPQYRLANVRTPQFVAFGERDVKVHMDRDFQSRTEYDIFKTLAASSVTITMSNGANNSVSLKAAAAIRDAYELGGLSGQGDIIKAGIDWVATYDATTSKAYEIVCTSTENVT